MPLHAVPAQELENFLGHDGFIWGIGVIEDRFDPLYSGRCKVRYFGIHTKDKKILPTEKLPWSCPLVDLDSGRAHVTGPKEGDWILSFFIDGKAHQRPIMIGRIVGIPEELAKPETGFYDPRPDWALSGHKVPREPKELKQHDDGSGNEIHEISPKSRWPDERFLKEPDTSRYERGINGCVFKSPSERIRTVIKLKKDNIKIGQTDIPGGEHIPGTGSDVGSGEHKWTESKTPDKAKYPYNKAYFSEGGHITEVDDTPCYERLHWYHRSGTFKEIHPDGKVVEKIVDKEHHICLKSRHIHTEAYDTHCTDWWRKDYVNKDCKPGYNWDQTIGEGGNINITIKDGKWNVYCNGDINVYTTGDCNLEVDKDLRATVHGNGNVHVDKNLRITVKENLDATVEQNVTMEVGGDVTEYIRGSKTSVILGNLDEIILGSATRYIGDTHSLVSFNDIQELSMGGKIKETAAEVHIATETLKAPDPEDGAEPVVIPFMMPPDITTDKAEKTERASGSSEPEETKKYPMTVDIPYVKVEQDE